MSEENLPLPSDFDSTIEICTTSDGKVEMVGSLTREVYYSEQTALLTLPVEDLG